MDKLTLGILAHVDAGKTTLSEALLYKGGALRTLGRVDHANAFLDTDDQEKERGITIFSKQAVLPLEDVDFTLLDTPGHVDFAAEAERVLGVLDCALLVISAPDGPQGHTLTLWKLLERHGVPTFLFLNKMDQPGVDRQSLLSKLRGALSDGILDFSGYGSASFWEEAALGDEGALEEYMEQGRLTDHTLRRLIARRRVFPCLFGSALKLEGVETLLDSLSRFAPRPRWGAEFGARVFKISRDPQGARLTHLKLTGGSLRVKSTLPGVEGKVEQIRIYSGAKFTPVEEAPAGTVCAVTGLKGTAPGQALGAERPWAPPALEAVMTYQLILPQGADPHAVLPRLRLLCEEDPQLCLEWKEDLGEIHMRLMGQVQAEVLKRQIQERFGLAVDFGPGSIVYRETIAAAVEGVGHFEPLRHYAEVHLLLEPLPRGRGVEIASACDQDALAVNWQRLILTHLAEKSHRGVLTGSPITDVRLTLVSGRAHEKHTEGGDFRQATYRAVRQGLMKARSILLEPWYDFRLELPAASLGRALSDIQRMGGETGPAQPLGEEAVLTGSVPVSAMGDYAAEVAAYTKGRGRLTCTAGLYRPCGEQDKVVEALGYDPERDVDDPAGSVFCAHGAGYNVPWNEVEKHMHLAALELGGPPSTEERPEPQQPRRAVPPSGGLEADRELMGIFEKTYGAVKPRAFHPPPPVPPRRESREAAKPPKGKPLPSGPEYLLVDGYNILFAWEELKTLARDDLDAARKTLMDILSNYQGFKNNRVILVFDAYKVPQGTGSVVKYHNIHVVYTKEAETADSYIEKASYRLSQEGVRVRVATSDGPIQFIILGHGALRMSAPELRGEVEQARVEIANILKRNNMKLPSGPVKAAFEKARGERDDLSVSERGKREQR
ncbi:translation factor GTPase family protein [Vermiculatibacterium agrestimuris]|uniref:translation factor GTPase family protein n=1 Tax=Vermiculatibacterium agrestimuris TaxID=2941519 RepID=UPI002040FD7C|nr:TetM/TetW/TetO/TetS family tetracycline resistance ribosomal protection protein [Vermiculatibacterium agrestimuris]